MSQGPADPWAPVDLHARDLQMASNPRVDLDIAPMNSYVIVSIRVDGIHTIATGVGNTVGEALMVAGAIMTATPMMPVHKRVLARLRRR
jgi:hypothetical protein